LKYVDEYRNQTRVREIRDELHRIVRGRWELMEVCGGQTHSIIRFSLDQMLPDGVNLVHGPGCPVCVTPAELIDQAVALAGEPGTILTSFGDMLRVPGSGEDLLTARARGGDVRIVYSPLDAVKLAAENPDRQVIFFAVGFETTAPTAAAAVISAQRLQLTNFSLLSAHFLVPPALDALLASSDNRVQAFLAPGHVCTITGISDYQTLSAARHVPIVITGFEPLDIMQGVLMTVRQLEEGRCEVENQYSRVVKPEGSPQARALMERVFEVSDRNWRGIGVIPKSGLQLRPEFNTFNAEHRFKLPTPAPVLAGECISGEVLRGVKRPTDCPAFGVKCSPEHPLGAPMVSSEGACAAYYRYRRAD